MCTPHAAHAAHAAHAPHAAHAAPQLHHTLFACVQAISSSVADGQAMPLIGAVILVPAGKVPDMAHHRYSVCRERIADTIASPIPIRLKNNTCHVEGMGTGKGLPSVDISMGLKFDSSLL